VGWYNGDWRPAISSQFNWYLSDQQFARVYDDFVVPDGGWTVTGVFAHTNMFPTEVTEACWEIREGVAEGDPGTLVASGLSPATQTQVDSVGDGKNVYLLQVNGLSVQLPPGRYWLSVAPVVPQSYSVTLPRLEMYICMTLGANAVGDPPGNNGAAFDTATVFNLYFAPVVSTGRGGTSNDASMGVILASAPVTPVSSATPWQADLAYLVQQMPLLHSLPYPAISLADFNRNAADLSARAPALSDPQIRTGLQALVASINDPHTTVSWGSPSPFRFLPLTFYWFDKGMIVTAASAQYQDVLGGKLLSIGRVSFDEAIQRLTPLAAHDNDQWLKATIPGNQLVNTDFLFGTGIIDNTDGAQIQVKLPSGDVVTDYVQAAPAGPRINVYQGPLPLARQHSDRNYWTTVLDGGATVYFQYNSCMEDPRQASADFLQQLDGMLAQDGVQRLIVDMRNNSGGLATILDPWIAKIAASRFNAPDRLYVMVGRATFSAAMEAADLFHDTTAATFVGEPTGAKPRFLLRRGDFALPYFGIRVSYSNGVEGAKDYGSALIPDIQVPVTFADYMNGADPALDAILAIPIPGN
jgi:hypothetical protein